MRPGTSTRFTCASSRRPRSGPSFTTGRRHGAGDPVRLDRHDPGCGVHPVDLLVAATALGDGFTVLTDDGDYANQIASVLN